MGTIRLVQGDITKVKADAIVNAANTSLLGGGGVDGAIHKAAGPELLEYCKKCGGARPGEAKISPGFRLPAKYVIHAVGPVWYGGNRREDEILKNAYLSSLKLARAKQLKSIAFPSISTGAYHFPKERAARIAIETIKSFINNNTYPDEIIFVLFDDESYQIYRSFLEK